MEVVINTPLNSFSLKPGDIVLTSDRALLVSTMNVNDYKYALVDLAKAEVVEMLTSVDKLTHVAGSIILKVVSNTEAKLVLP